MNLERQREAGYLVSVPILSRCCAEARTFEEAGEMAADAIRAYRTQIGEAGRLR
jgi:predicted RNase H-like HicB family nuclease